MKRLISFALLLVLLSMTMGCEDEKNPFQRKEIPKSQNTPSWRYYHNYKMYVHEHKVLERTLGSGKIRARNSWGRLREYLIGMRDNMPSEKSFEFLTIFNEYDTTMDRFLNKNVSANAISNRLGKMRKKVMKDYRPEKVYPDFKVGGKEK